MSPISHPSTRPRASSHSLQAALSLEAGDAALEGLDAKLDLLTVVQQRVSIFSSILLIVFMHPSTSQFELQLRLYEAGDIVVLDSLSVIESVS